MKADRAKAMEALRQIEEHSPTWVAIIRAYIRFLERKVERHAGQS